MNVNERKAIFSPETGSLQPINTLTSGSKGSGLFNPDARTQKTLLAATKQIEEIVNEPLEHGLPFKKSDLGLDIKDPRIENFKVLVEKFDEFSKLSFWDRVLIFFIGMEVNILDSSGGNTVIRFHFESSLEKQLEEINIKLNQELGVPLLPCFTKFVKSSIKLVKHEGLENISKFMINQKIHGDTYKDYPVYKLNTATEPNKPKIVLGDTHAAYGLGLYKIMESLSAEGYKKLNPTKKELQDLQTLCKQERTAEENISYNLEDLKNVGQLMIKFRKLVDQGDIIRTDFQAEVIFTGDNIFDRKMSTLACEYMKLLTSLATPKEPIVKYIIGNHDLYQEKLLFSLPINHQFVSDQFREYYRNDSVKKKELETAWTAYYNRGCFAMVDNGVSYSHAGFGGGNDGLYHVLKDYKIEFHLCDDKEQLSRLISDQDKKLKADFLDNRSDFLKKFTNETRHHRDNNFLGRFPQVYGHDGQGGENTEQALNINTNGHHYNTNGVIII